MLRSLTTRLSDESGFGLVGILMAALILIVGVLGGLLALGAAERTAFGAQRSEQALSIAQREIEAIKAMPYANVGLTAAPVPDPSGPASPHYWVRGTAPNRRLFLARAYRDADSPSIANAPPDGSEALHVGGTVVSGPSAFDAGATTGRIYRYVTWRDERNAYEADHARANKRVTVAVVLDSEGPRAPAPVWLSTFVTDPEAAPPGITRPPEPTPGTPVSAQPFFLYDTPCSFAARQTVAASHPSRATAVPGANCASATPSDLMAPPPAPGPADGAEVPRYDMASEQPRSDGAGIVLRPGSADCPRSAAEPTVAHRWVTSAFPAAFSTPSTDARTALNFVGRTADGVAMPATLCARVTASGNPDGLLASGAFSLASWPGEPTSLAFTMDHAPFTIPVGQRLVLTLSLTADSPPLELRLDHPADRTFLSVAATTPQG